jgi:hypothetical protein
MNRFAQHNAAVALAVTMRRPYSILQFCPSGNGFELAQTYNEAV